MSCRKTCKWRHPFTPSGVCAHGCHEEARYHFNDRAPAAACRSGKTLKQGRRTPTRASTATSATAIWRKLPFNQAVDGDHHGAGGRSHSRITPGRLAPWSVTGCMVRHGGAVPGATRRPAP